MVPHRGNPTINGAGSDRYQNLDMVSKFPKGCNIFGVTKPSLNQTDLDMLTAVLDISEWATVKHHMLTEGKKPLIDIEK
jgi:hypothetical protein